MAKVALVKGDDRFTNVLGALELAGEEVSEKVRGDILVKVNTVVSGESLANTQPDAIRAVLEYLKRFHPRRVRVGEASENPMEIFQSEKYLSLTDQYDFVYVDFNTLGFDDLELITIESSPLPARISRVHKECDCLISLSVPKAHSDAVLTLSGKNMMGFLESEQMWRVHGIREFGRDEDLVACTRTIHKNLRTLLKIVQPDIAVLDGFHSFEAGTIPQCAKGDYVEPHIAVAGADFVAVDAVTATVLGYDPLDIGYLVYAAEDGYGTLDLERIQIVGTSIEHARFPLKPAPRNETLVKWRTT